MDLSDSPCWYEKIASENNSSSGEKLHFASQLAGTVYLGGEVMVAGEVAYHIEPMSSRFQSTVCHGRQVQSQGPDRTVH